MQSLRLQKKQWTSSVQQEKLNQHYFEAGDFACLFVGVSFFYIHCAKKKGSISIKKILDELKEK